MGIFVCFCLLFFFFYLQFFSFFIGCKQNLVCLSCVSFLEIGVLQVSEALIVSTVSTVFELKAQQHM